MKCPTGQIYKECGPALEPSCSASFQVFDTSICHEGCFCADGTFKHKGTCIPHNKCPCSYGGKEFPIGKTMKQDCVTCKCTSGIWDCPDIQCGARCEMISGIHHITFDKKRYDFNGKCSYYLLQTANFSIIEQYVDEQQIVLIQSFIGNRETKIDIKSGNVIKIDGRDVDVLPKILLGGVIAIRQASTEMILVEFADGVRIWFDGVSRLAVDVPALYRGQTEGLCGTFTDNIEDDFLTPEGDHETTVLPFVDKWRVEETCDMLDVNLHELQPCEANIEYSGKAQFICDQLRRVFDKGSHVVNIDPYYEDCMFDVCACKDKDIRKCACSMFAAYAAEVTRHDIVVDWRNDVPECCRFLILF